MPLITRSVSGWVGGCAEGEKGHFIRRTVWYLNIATHLTASCAIERVGGTCRRELRHRSRAAPGLPKRNVNSDCGEWSRCLKGGGGGG